jgi:hypothetical protein
VARQLHVLGLSADGRHVLLGVAADATKPSHRLQVDDRLRAAVRGDLGPPGTGEVTSALTPREIQARLRAGESPEELARAAGVPVLRVMRYAGPVLSEREQVIEGARAATMRRPRRGESATPLGAAVESHLGDLAGVKDDSVSWSAFRRPDGRWVVAVVYHSRGRQRRAEWLWDASGHSVEPLDSVAAGLGYVANGDSPAAAAKSARAYRARADKPGGKAQAGAASEPKSKRALPVERPGGKAEAEAAAERVAPAQRGSGRASVPSWSDVLLGGGTDPQRRRRG